MTGDTRMMIHNLIDKIGATLTDAALGGPRGLAHDVRNGRRTLSDDQVIKVTVLDEVLTDVIEHQGLQTARLWTIGANPFLDGTVVTAVREGRYDAVRDATRSFISSDFTG